MKYGRFLTALIMLWAACFSVVFAAEEVSNVETLELSFHSSKHFKLNNSIEKIFIGSAEIATVVQIPPTKNEFVITAKGVEGSTTLFIWTTGGTKYEYIINVSKEQAGAAAVIEKAIGLPDVHVRKVDDRVLLTGTVKNQYERNYAIQTARLYVGGGSKASLNFGSTVNPSLSTQSSKADDSNTTLTNTDKVEDGGKVIDLLQMLKPTQIRLEAQVLAINPEDSKNLGILYGTSSYSGDTRAPGNQGIFYLGESNTRNDMSSRSFKSNPWSWLMERHADINMSINALITNSNAKILSRPSIMTLSGEQATIQIGGEVPYTVSNANGTTVNFKDYGIILQFKPIVDSQNNIVATVYTEVSNLSGQSVDGQPIITTRRADAVVNLKSGSTMVVGGLMDSSETKAVSKIPLLGDIPILGEFFKYTSKSKKKQELIILMTPYIMDQEETSQAGMSESLREHYHAGQREKNSYENVDLNAPPPPLPDKKNKRKGSSTQPVNEPFE
ncbi:MAG: pilus assembly protein N-terminal domain-containing protein [Selenomonadaceae bacterium]|nr:pilus assembly protein N-terminal domain-containing protein [Selenomonadaceae bacterium]